jgi:NTE family protein
VTRALVLGGGGVTGVAWETGVLLGLERAGIPLREADLIVGTSAGSVVAAQVAGPTPLEELFAAQIDGWGAELASRLGLGGILTLVGAMRFTRDERAALAKVGRSARRATTPDEATRRAVIEARLPVHEWPDRAVKIPAVDAMTGELRVFDRSSGVSLVDAVGASASSALIAPDAEARRAMGRNSLDPAFRAASAEAGLAQSGRVADLVRGAWG